MKKKFLTASIILISAVMIGGCKKDNFEKPTSMITGRVVYQNQPVGVRSNGVQLELWQSGYQLFTKVAVNVNQDGTFAAEMFDGTYKLTRLRGNGPWADNTDTISVVLNGAVSVDVPVDPYFLVKSSAFTKTGTTVAATVSLQRVNTTKALELVKVYIGQTILVDQSINATSAQVLAAAIPDAAQPVVLNVTIPAALTGKDFVYARVGVKTVGVNEYAYGEPQKVMLK